MKKDEKEGKRPCSVTSYPFSEFLSSIFKNSALELLICSHEALIERLQSFRDDFCPS
jgi:hypothetical protein